MRETCALCHVGELPDGSLWFGMPNRRLDMARFRAEVSARWVAEGHEPLISETEASKATSYGPGRTGAETGDYPQSVPADFPPYWLLGARTHLNYLGTGGDIRSEVYLSIFSAGAGAPDEATAPVPFPVGHRIDSFVAFMGSMSAPPPPSGDAARIAAGRALFTREGCDGCHHVGDVGMNGVTTYDRDPAGRERLPGEDDAFPRGAIRTSYLHRILIDGDPVPDVPDAGTSDLDAAMPDAGMGMDMGRDLLIRFIVRNRLRVMASDGYRVQALEGVWATAPYLHNGSVPTLEDLLRPASERPTSFMRGDFLVDTTVPGNSNQGHEFGTAITEEERTDLAAYLRSL
jgi:mono/diheme cytochrome c family protein